MRTYLRYILLTRSLLHFLHWCLILWLSFLLNLRLFHYLFRRYSLRFDFCLLNLYLLNLLFFHLNLRDFFCLLSLNLLHFLLYLLLKWFFLYLWSFYWLYLS
jgi:hypothetical protein